ncbi:MAG: ABC transporter permease [Actinobacteria bacterium]|nr:ABC transporter permease [Actinomycetota bacterium]
MTESFFAEVMKLRRRPAMWVLLSLWFAMALAFGYVIPYLVYQNPPSGGAGVDRQQLLASLVPAGWLGNVVSGFPLFGAAMVLIAGILVVGSEFGWNTMGTLMTQRPRRLEVLSGKLGALAVLVALFELVVFAPGALASAIIARALDAPVDWPHATEMLRVFAGGFLILGAWAAIGVALAVLFRSTALPVGLGLVWLLVIESLVNGFGDQLSALGSLRQALPGTTGGSLAASFASNLPDTPGVSAVTGPVHAVVVLLVWGIASIVLASVFLRRRDVT